MVSRAAGAAAFILRLAAGIQPHPPPGSGANGEIDPATGAGMTA